jgi:hypothetical protein
MTLVTLVSICVLLCLAMAASPLPSSDMVDPESSRARSTRRAEARLGATIFALAVLAIGILLALERGSTGPILPLALVTTVGLVALHPWLAVRWCIPLGLPRLAVGLGRLGGHPWVRDPEGGAVLGGVLAQLRRPVDPEVHAWLRTRLRRGPLRGAGLVAAGLLAADAGDRDTARAHQPRRSRSRSVPAALAAHRARLAGGRRGAQRRLGARAVADRRSPGAVAHAAPHGGAGPPPPRRVGSRC